MGWFSNRLSGSQKEEALVMVRHLQTMLAYQQLTMETYNDAADNDGAKLNSLLQTGGACIIMKPE